MVQLLLLLLLFGSTRGWVGIPPPHLFPYTQIYILDLPLPSSLVVVAGEAPSQVYLIFSKSNVCCWFVFVSVGVGDYSGHRKGI